jgi:hypothetical protein
MLRLARWGLSARRRRRGPLGPKEGSRRPARHGVLPRGRRAAGGCYAAIESAADLRGATPVRWPATVRRASRALEDVERVVTGQA